jgi:glucose-6-phosphate 1-dehydrogenase
LITPILDYWAASGAEGLEEYAAGSWGPEASEQLLEEGGHQWRRSG